MCFYCHKLYNFSYFPPHGHLDCPELVKINKYGNKLDPANIINQQPILNPNLFPQK